MANAPARTSKCQSAPYFASQSSASRGSRASSVTRSARPSTTTSKPWCSVLVPVVTTTSGFVARFRALRSSGPVQKCNASSDQSPISGVTCGRPSGRAVDSQNTSARVSTATASDHGRAVASLSL